MKRPSSVSSHRCPWLNRHDRGPSPSRRKADSDIVHTQTSPLLTFSPKVRCYADFTMPSAVDKLARSMRYMSVSNPWNGELLIGMEEISLAADDLRFSLSLSRGRSC